MPLPNVTGAIIATGYNCKVRVGSSATDAEVIALVTSFQVNEDFQAQEAVCIGNLGPVSIDPQGYNCTITIDGFLPSKKVLNGEIQYDKGGKKAIMDFIPTRAQYMQIAETPKIAYLDFYRSERGDMPGIVLASFEGVLISSDGMSVEGNTYARVNVQMRALSKN
jgi:hypothetical protein